MLTNIQSIELKNLYEGNAWGSQPSNENTSTSTRLT